MIEKLLLEFLYSRRSWLYGKRKFMVEVFKTDVQTPGEARELLQQIHRSFSGFSASSELEDRDRVLRIEGVDNEAEAYALIGFLDNFGCKAEILP